MFIQMYKIWHLKIHHLQSLFCISTGLQALSTGELLAIILGAVGAFLLLALCLLCCCFLATYRRRQRKQYYREEYSDYDDDRFVAPAAVVGGPMFGYAGGAAYHESPVARHRRGTVVTNPLMAAAVPSRSPHPSPRGVRPLAVGEFYDQQPIAAPVTFFESQRRPVATQPGPSRVVLQPSPQPSRPVVFAQPGPSGMVLQPSPQPARFQPIIVQRSPKRTTRRHYVEPDSTEYEYDSDSFDEYSEYSEATSSTFMMSNDEEDRRMRNLLGAMRNSAALNVSTNPWGWEGAFRYQCVHMPAQRFSKYTLISIPPFEEKTPLKRNFNVCGIAVKF